MLIVSLRRLRTTSAVLLFFFFSSRRRHTRLQGDWSSDVCSSDLERGVDPKALYIYGHSLGGAIAIELARRHPEAAGLVVEASFTSIADMARLEIGRASCRERV